MQCSLSSETDQPLKKVKKAEENRRACLSLTWPAEWQLHLGHLTCFLEEHQLIAHTQHLKLTPHQDQLTASALLQGPIRESLAKVESKGKAMVKQREVAVQVEWKEEFDPWQGKHLEVGEVRRQALSTIFVKDLSKSVEESHLKDFFGQFGEVGRVWLASEPSLALHFAYLAFRTPQQAELCFASCARSPFLLEDSQPSVSLYFPRENKSLLPQQPQKVAPQQISSHLQHSHIYSQQKLITPTLQKPILSQKQQPVLNCSPEGPNKSLYVKNLPAFWGEEQLRVQLGQVFGKWGAVQSVNIKVDSTQKRLYAFVTFEQPEQAERALRLHNQDVFLTGLPLFVSWAERKSDRFKPSLLLPKPPQ